MIYFIKTQNFKPIIKQDFNIKISKTTILPKFEKKKKIKTSKFNKDLYILY